MCWLQERTLPVISFEQIEWRKLLMVTQEYQEIDSRYFPRTFLLFTSSTMIPMAVKKANSAAVPGLLLGFFLFTVTASYKTANFPGTSRAVPCDSLVKTFTNPVANGADPWVIKQGNFYYVCQSDGSINSKGISVSKSNQLSRPGKRVHVWSAPLTGWNSNHIWAPELHRFGNKWYIYYAAGKSGPPYIHQRSGVLESVSNDPQGAYIDKGILHTGADENDPTGTIWAIDVTVSMFNGKLYAAWSGWEHNASTDKTSQHLYIAAMSNPWTISSERVKISSPDQTWERGGPLNLNEGPQFYRIMVRSLLFIPQGSPGPLNIVWAS